MKKYIKAAYDRAVLINHPGHAYEFYANVKRRPTLIYLPPRNEYDLDLYKERGYLYMDKDDFRELWELIRRDRKPFGLGLMFSKRHFEEDLVHHYLSAYRAAIKTGNAAVIRHYRTAYREAWEQGQKDLLNCLNATENTFWIKKEWQDY